MARPGPALLFVVAAELDYVFLAESVRLEANGIMNALGMSYTHTWIPTLPVGHPVVLGGRVWVDGAEVDVEMALGVQGPPDTFSIATTHMLEVLEGEPELDGRRSVSFAVHFIVPVTEYGTYTFDLAVDESPVKSVSFVVVEELRG